MAVAKVDIEHEGEPRPTDADRELAHRLGLPEGASEAPGAERDHELPVREVETLILGAGVSGLATAIGLKREGRHDFLIVDRAESIGGTWHHNRYPGCAVDIPSHLYSFSYDMNPDWGRTYAEQPELEAYIQRAAEKFALDAHLSLGTELDEARWDEDMQRWIVQTSRGEIRARFFVLAAGPLHDPMIPDLPGLSNFRGAMFHSANWPEDDVDIEGKSVAVIGTGASAVQFIPRIQPKVKQLAVFQRTPGWVLPKIDWRTTKVERWLMRHVPGLMSAVRWLEWTILDGALMAIVRHPKFARVAHLAGRFNIRRAVRDRRVRRQLTPSYTVTCKRAMFSNEYYPTFDKPNVELVSTGVEEIRANSIVGADGTEREVDTIIFGTGFHVLTTHPVAERIYGKQGESLAGAWRGSPRAYKGTSIAGFPNAFMLFGPNIGTLSGFVMAEIQVGYILGAMESADRSRATSVDVRPEVQVAFNAALDRDLQGTTFTTGGCMSYYLDKVGRVTMAWPYTMHRMRRELRDFDPGAYELAYAARTSEPSPRASDGVDGRSNGASPRREPSVP